jgi:hypothetical protein
MAFVRRAGGGDCGDVRVGGQGAAMTQIGARPDFRLDCPTGGTGAPNPANLPMTPCPKCGQMPGHTEKCVEDVLAALDRAIEQANRERKQHE